MAREHFNFKMCSPWRMKTPKMQQPWLTKRWSDKWCKASGLVIHYIVKLLSFHPTYYLFILLAWQDNVFVMSNKKSKYPVLQLDLRLKFIMTYIFEWISINYFYLLGWVIEVWYICIYIYIVEIRNNLLLTVLFVRLLCICNFVSVGHHQEFFA